MSFFGDNLAIFYRNFTAATTAIGLVLLLIWALFSNSNIPSTIGRDNTTAIVTKVKVSTGNNSYQLLELQLADTNKFNAVINVKQIPEIGDTMPVYVFLHENNKKSYSVDQDKWRIDNHLYKR